ncbi:unnamed protein product, partial [Ostreobium quekettii]
MGPCCRWTLPSVAKLRVVLTVVVMFLGQDSVPKAGGASSHDSGVARACGVGASSGHQ